MKNFWKPILQFMIVGGIILGITWLVNLSKPKEQYVKLDIRDRENGICAEMYKEGYIRGSGQFKVDWQIEHWNYKHQKFTRMEKALAWYEYWEQVMKIKN